MSNNFLLRTAKFLTLCLTLCALSGCCIWGFETNYANEWHSAQSGNQTFDSNVPTQATINKALEECKIETYRGFANVVDSAELRNENTLCMQKSGYVYGRVSKGVTCKSMKFF